MTDKIDYISPEKFLAELMRYKKGSVSRRHFLGVTGLGLATSVLGAALPGLRGAARAEGSIGDRVVLASWPNYHDPANFDAFTAKTGALVDLNVFGSNEEMLAKLQAGGTGWDVFVPTNYTISTYVDLGLIEPLDMSKIPNYDPTAFDPRFAGPGTIDGKIYAVSKDWGTTGMGTIRGGALEKANVEVVTEQLHRDIGADAGDQLVHPHLDRLGHDRVDAREVGNDLADLVDQFFFVGVAPFFPGLEHHEGVGLQLEQLGRQVGE